MNYTNFFMNADIPIKEVAPGVRRKVLAHHDNLMVCELTFEKGAIGAMHSHPHEQISYIVEGVFEFNVNGEKKVVRVGDTVYKQGNLEHGAVCLEKGKLIDVFSPQRKDFLA